MFKNLQLYKIIQAAIPENFADVLQASAFVPCGASQEKSVGWVPPRGEANGLLMETIGGQHILKLMTETKAVPASVVKRKVQEQLQHIEATTGRKPGKKEARAIREDASLALLPLAFTKQSATLIWIDTANKLLTIDASSQSKADEAVTQLVKSLDGLGIQLVNTKTSPSAAMAAWLIEDHDELFISHSFIIDRECELKASDESKAVVKYGRHPLDIEEVAQHIRMGKMPTKLALTWNDRVSFVLTEGLALKKLAFLDVCFEESKSDTAADHFDADVAISTGELSKLIPDLFEALGGVAA